MTGGGLHKMEPEVADQIAQEKFGKNFDELEGRERQSVAGTYGGNKRKEEMGAAHGGDVSAAYSEMSRQTDPASQSGTTKTHESKMEPEEADRIAQEKFGKNFNQLSGNERQSVAGTYGGNKRKEDMGAAHGGDVSAAYSEMSRQTDPKSQESKE